MVMTGAAVEWRTADPLVAVVDSAGHVTSVGNGTTAVSATARGVTGSATLTVAQEVSAVAVTPDFVLFTALGDTATLTAGLTDATGREVAEAVVTWSTSDASVAAVDQAGLVTATGAGVTQVTATSDSLTASADVEVSAGISGDRQVLELLYRAWNGDSWNDPTNWLSDAPLSEWAGVRTDRSGRVTTLSLRDWNLEGRIPASIGLLDQLFTLNVSENSLYGPIPPDLGRLTRLRDLLLARNDISGPIPPELGTHRPV